MKSRQYFSIVVSFLFTLTSPAKGFQIRLAGSGSTRCSGRVEIYHNNTWGTICDDNWDMNDAKVVCQQLGCGMNLRAPRAARFGEGTGNIWLDDVDCSGSEGSLSDCKHKTFGKNDCSHDEDAGVVCSAIRLTGYTRCSGKVEIYHNGTWGTVCDDSWDLNDTEVVCRHLDCGTAVAATVETLFGRAGRSRNIWLDDVDCSGSEGSLSQCRHSGFGNHDCSHNEDAGVVCSATLPKPSISVNPSVVVSWGQNVSITCSSSPELSGGAYILKKSPGSFTGTESSDSNIATFRIYNVDFDHEGLYQCQYERKIADETYRSSLSDSVRLSVTVNFPKPSLSMSPIGEVTWGQDVHITCSISTQFLGGSFILFNTLGSFKEIQTLSTNSATFSIPKVGFADGGLYLCWYEKMNISSTLSNSVRLSVTVPLSLLVSSIAGGILLLLLLVLVVGLVYRGRRGKAKQPGALILSQLSVKARNKFEDDKNHDYINFDLENINKEIVGKVADDTYEKPESDEDPHYDELDPSKHLKSKVVCVSVEHNRKDQEEDVDENVYVDVSHFYKLDVNGENEDMNMNI
ncbi:scavenger receptor cysteine-rich domain-containing protein DMBT1 [Paralichthys olivaceus]|uniref:scavenger receptor cysteine-rich domain-containing protein DMBT1 n=1 Tax=Paralichthys olivaceus TaxID=8255 RepID=UPI00375329BF